MVTVLRVAFGLIALLAATGVQALQLAYEPVGLSWSAAEVEGAATGNISAIEVRAEQSKQMGCMRHCERLDRIFARLVAAARAQTDRAASLPWSLTVVRLPDVDAMAMPGGQVIISETFIDERALSDEALAFVLAHEMAHSILEHERQALTFARMLLPREVPRSVQDMYVEMDFNMALLIAMEPVLQQGEFEADELGFLLASAVGYAPDSQLAFLEQEASAHSERVTLVATHPPVQQRLEQLRQRLPLARRLYPANPD